MKLDRYEFAEGARFQAGAQGTAPIVGAHLEVLRRQADGELTPQSVVEDARNPNSPLHSFFEWDDSEAAERYRLEQARGLIRSVVAVYPREDAAPARVRAYVHVAEPAPSYREVTQALSSAGSRAAVLKRALAELRAWRKRYADLKEFASMVQIIDDTEKALDLQT